MLIGDERTGGPEPAAAAGRAQGELFGKIALRLALCEAENVGFQKILVNGQGIVKILERGV